jgi:hypothetical protein
MALKAKKIAKVTKVAKRAQKKKVVATGPVDAFTKKEEAVLKSLNTPEKIQMFLDGLHYDGADDYFSVRSTLRTRKAHCMGGAMIAACCLERLGYGPPRVVGFDAHNDDSHAVAVYQKNGYWGAVGKSNFTLIRSRQPVYKTLREMMMSYFDFYFNTARELSLTTYSKPFNLNRTGKAWKFAEGSVGKAIDDFDDDRVTPQIPFIPKGMRKTLGKASKAVLKAGLLGSNPAGLFKPS